jgi:hypothetical protein
MHICKIACARHFILIALCIQANVHCALQRTLHNATYMVQCNMYCAMQRAFVPFILSCEENLTKHHLQIRICTVYRDL